MRGQGREQIKYQYIQTILENIIEYHRMFSNLLVHVSACVHDQKVFSLFFLTFFFFIFRNMQGNFITYIAKYFRELRVRSDSVVTLTQIENPIRGINNDNSNAQRGEENRHKMSKLSRHISPQFLFFSFFCNYRNFDV